MWFKLFVWIMAIVQSAGVALIIALRCQLDDEIDCAVLKGKSLSWLLDWSWIQTFSAMLLGGAAFLNIWFAFGLLYPCYRDPFRHWYIWALRMLHAAGFFGVAVVGTFDLNEHNTWHMRAAFWLFIALSLECILVLFVPENICNVRKWFRPQLYLSKNEAEIWERNNYRLFFFIQMLHAIAIPTFAMLYVIEDYGPFEWISIWLILFYFTWYARDHQKDIVHVDLVDHPTIPACSYGEFTPMRMDSLQRTFKH